MAAEIFTLAGALGLTFAQGNSNVCDSDYSITLTTPVMDNLEPLLEVYWGPLAPGLQILLNTRDFIKISYREQNEEQRFIVNQCCITLKHYLKMYIDVLSYMI